MRKLLVILVIALVAVSCNKDEILPVDFSSNKNKVTAMTPVTFTNKSTTKGFFVWNFGDGGRSDEINPTYVFRKAGARTVTLTAMSDGAQKKRVITVNGQTFSVINNSGVDLSNVLAFSVYNLEAVNIQELGYLSQRQETLGFVSSMTNLHIAIVYYNAIYFVAEEFILTNNNHKLVEITAETQVYIPSRGQNKFEGNQKYIRIKDL